MQDKKTDSSLPEDKTTTKEAPFLVLKGFLMGSADIVPGVSGGTMALIVGIYERLLDAIRSVDTTFLKQFFTLQWAKAFRRIHFFFLITLFAGIFAALGFFTKVVPLQVYMFTHPEIVYGLFFGLILGSIYILYKEIGDFGWQEALMVVVGIGIGIWVVNLVPADTPDHPLFVFLSANIAICAMILPGISGSYLLLIMRKYEYLLYHIGLLGGVETKEGILGLLPFVAGAITGLALFSRFLSWLLKKFHSQTIAVLVGFLLGSLYIIWPFQHREYVEQVRDRQWLQATSPKVVELRQNPPNENLPEFERLGEMRKEGAAFEEMKQVEVVTVKKKLIHSEPFIPAGWRSTPDDDPDVWGGLIGMLIGMVLVVGLEKMREAEEEI